MGSPISPVLANLYMEEFEQRALKHINCPRLWKRYVDDTFVIIRSRSLTSFLDHLNSLQPGVICFTHEMEKDNALPFLEVLVKRNKDGCLSTSIYRKPTHTDQLLNFDSHHPLSSKRSVVSSLSKRCNLIPSTTEARTQEKFYLRGVFAANNYTKEFVFQAAFQSTSVSKSPNCDSPKATVTIPYIKGISEHIRRILAECNIQIRFKTVNTLRQLLSHPKDQTQIGKQSCVVYSIPCRDCNSSYIGETGQHLSTRLHQHKEATKKGDVDKSAVSEHVWSHNHNMDWANVCIIDHDSQTVSRRIREAIHIRRSSGASLMNRDYDLELTHMWDMLLNI